MKEKYPILFFDGVCNLCNASVQWILKYDSKRHFTFAALQSSYGQDYLKNQHLQLDQYPTLILALSPKQYLEKGDALLYILKHLRPPHPFLGKIYGLLPSFLRNKIYQTIAQNRYKILGKKNTCLAPREEWKERFI